MRPRRATAEQHFHIPGHPLPLHSVLQGSAECSQMFCRSMFSKSILIHNFIRLMRAMPVSPIRQFIPFIYPVTHNPLRPNGVVQMEKRLIRAWWFSFTSNSVENYKLFGWSPHFRGLHSSHRLHHHQLGVGEIEFTPFQSRISWLLLAS